MKTRGCFIDSTHFLCSACTMLKVVSLLVIRVSNLVFLSDPIIYPYDVQGGDWSECHHFKYCEQSLFSFKIRGKRKKLVFPGFENYLPGFNLGTLHSLLLVKVMKYYEIIKLK